MRNNTTSAEVMFQQDVNTFITKEDMVMSDYLNTIFIMIWFILLQCFIHIINAIEAHNPYFVQKKEEDACHVIGLYPL